MASNRLLLVLFVAIVVITITKKAKVKAITGEDVTINTKIKVNNPNIADFKYGFTEFQFLISIIYATNFQVVFLQLQTSLRCL
jgi:hypothetical protein